jgi:hypothetical protein
MNEEIQRHVTNDRSRDEPTAAKCRQPRAFKIGGVRITRFFSQRQSDDAEKRETPLKANWVCSVCSHNNVNSDDHCFRCQFFREKPEPSDVSMATAKKPGAYKVVEKGPHQHVLRPVRNDRTYLRKTDKPQKTVTSNENTLRQPMQVSGSSPQPREVPAVSSDDTIAVNTATTTAEAANTMTTPLSNNFASKPPRGTLTDDDALQNSERSIPLDDLYIPDAGINLTPSARKSSSTYQMQMSYGGWSESEKSAWECSVCTYINEDAMHLTCAVCGNKRDTVSAFAMSDRSIQDISVLQDTETREEKRLRNTRMHELIMMQYELMAELTKKENSDGCEGEFEEVQHKTRSTIKRQESLDQLSRQMSEIITIHEDDRKQQKLVRGFQEHQKESIIEDESSAALSDSIEKGASIPSNEEHRMLDQWQQELEMNAKKIQELQRQQEDLMRDIENDHQSRR